MIKQLPLSVVTNYQRAHTLPVIADFFISFPRIWSAPKEFSSHVKILDYLRLAIPFAIVTVVILLLALIANFYFFFKRGVVPGADDTQESDPNKRDFTGRAFLVFSCFLNLAIIICIALSLSSAFSMNQAANNSHAILKGFRSFTEDATIRAVDALLYAGEIQVEESNEEQARLNKEIRDMLHRDSNALKALKSLISQMPPALNNLDEQLKYFSKHYFEFTTIILFLCFLGCLVIVLSDATTPDARKIRILAFSILLIPLVATWAHTAISSSVAVASGDFCQAIDEYRNDVASTFRDTEPRKAKKDLAFDLHCPALAPDAKELRKITKFVKNRGLYTNGEANFTHNFNMLTNLETTDKDWKAIDNALSVVVSCDLHLEVSGHLLFEICGDHEQSAMTAIGQIWLCSCGLTLLFTTVVVLLTFGHPPSEFCTGRELMYIFGAPLLISAFGDVRGVLHRHSKFHRKKRKHPSISDISYTSTEELNDMERIAMGYKLAGEESFQTPRSRKMGYAEEAIAARNDQEDEWFRRKSRDLQQGDTSDFS